MYASLPRDWESLSRMARQLEGECQEKLQNLKDGDLTETSKVEELLKKMNQVSEQMEGLMSQGASGSYMLVQRNQDVHAEMMREFRKCKPKRALMEREELLEGGLLEQDDLITERQRLDNAHTMIDETIEQAIETRRSLFEQDSVLKSAKKRMQQVVGMMPSLRRITFQISQRRLRDKVILGVTTAIIIIFFFMLR